MAQLGELARLTALDEGSPQSFRVRAYENAIQELTIYTGELASLTQTELTDIDGIGKSTAKKIREFFDTGEIRKLTELRETFPADFVALSEIPGIGLKTLLRLRAELGVENLDDLRAAIAGEKLRALKGMGAKTEEKIASALARLAT